MGVYEKWCRKWLKVFVSSKQRLIVCLEESLYIHNIRDMKVLHTIRETPPNPSGAPISYILDSLCVLLSF